MEATIIIALVVGVLFVLALIKVIREWKKPCGGCGSCPYADGCKKRRKPPER